MNIAPDYLLERKKNKQHIQKLKFIIVGLLAIFALFYSYSIKSKQDFTNQKDYIALVSLEEVIYDNFTRDQKLLALKEDKNAKALVVLINSPGGGAGASEKIYKILKSIRTEKPVVCVMDSIAASGGYMISLGAEYILAQNSTITGSIGVIMQNYEILGLAEKLGIVIQNFKSGELKASPNPTEKLTPEVAEATMATVMDVYNFFVDLVAENRNIPRNHVLQIADGRIYTGRQAHALNLVDDIGTIEDAKKWLQEKKNISKDLKIIQVSLKDKLGLWEQIISKIFGSSESSVRGLLAKYTDNIPSV